jgi:hypothetical protein
MHELEGFLERQVWVWAQVPSRLLSDRRSAAVAMLEAAGFEAQAFTVPRHGRGAEPAERRPHPGWVEGAGVGLRRQSGSGAPPPPPAGSAKPASVTVPDAMTIYVGRAAET